MFYCGKCKKLMDHGIKPKRVVVETRPRVYTGTVYDRDLRSDVKREVGEGWEIVKEMNLGPCCSGE